jgi:anti-sigma-K factor RskA
MAPDLHTLTGAYAADAMNDDEERRDFEQHLARCADCREEVRTLRETVAVLAAAMAVPPPPDLRARVLAEVAATRQWPLPGSREPDRSASSRLVGVAAAVALVAGLAVGGAGLYEARQAHQRQESAQRLADRIASLLADPAARRASGEVVSGGRVTLVVADSQAVVVTTGVTRLPSNRTYQLWVLRAHRVRSAGLGPGGGAAGGSWNRLVDDVRAGDQVAISVEPAGGSAQPTTTPISVLRA